MFKVTTALRKVARLNKFVKAIQGGTSAGKTYVILAILIDIAIKEDGVLISVCSESLPHLKRGCIKDFVDIMRATGRFYPESFYKSSPCSYEFGNGSKIEFFSASDAEAQRGARRDYLYLNECNNLSFDAYTELAPRTKKGIFLDWNPTAPFWFHEHLESDENVDFLIINYLDNEACPESARYFIEQAKEKAKDSEYYKQWYQTYGLGQLGQLQDTVFQFTQCNAIPENAKFYGYGLDFGYSVDPSAMVGLWKHDGALYVKEIMYETNLTNPDIYKRAISKGVTNYDKIVADSAEPKSIQELFNAGFTYIQPATKGRDSINYSIDLLRQHPIYVTSDSLNVIKEMRSYTWAKDKNGNKTNKPIDKHNHSLDALRYIAMDGLQKPFEYVIL